MAWLQPDPANIRGPKTCREAYSTVEDSQCRAFLIVPFSCCTALCVLSPGTLLPNGDNSQKNDCMPQWVRYPRHRRGHALPSAGNFRPWHSPATSSVEAHVNAGQLSWRRGTAA